MPPSGTQCGRCVPGRADRLGPAPREEVTTEGRGPAGAGGGQGRGGARHLRRVRAARRRRRDDVGGMRRARPRAAGKAYGMLRRHRAGAATWRRCGRRWRCHRPAEFNKGHLPAFLNRRNGPATTSACNPFVRSYEWYLLPDKERRRRFAGRARPDGPAGTRTFGRTRCPRSAPERLHEWVLAFEADELHRIVDLIA